MDRIFVESLLLLRTYQSHPIPTATATHTNCTMSRFVSRLRAFRSVCHLATLATTASSLHFNSKWLLQFKMGIRRGKSSISICTSSSSYRRYRRHRAVSIKYIRSKLNEFGFSWIQLHNIRNCAKKRFQVAAFAMHFVWVSNAPQSYESKVSDLAKWNDMMSCDRKTHIKL